MKTDVYALGELLIDLMEGSESGQYEAKPGGAPANALAMLEKLGSRTFLQACVGADAFGRRLIQAASEAGIATSGIRQDPLHPTTLAVVSRDENGDRTFSFYRQNTADLQLRPEDIDESRLQETEIVHFGTLSLVAEPARSTARELVTRARQAGKHISFDPNLRENLWSDLEEAKEAMRWGLEQCDILKISDNEIAFLTGTDNVAAGMEQLLADYPNVKVAAATRGKDGCLLYFPQGHAEHPGYAVEAIETTGAGDTFTGCLLRMVLEQDPADWNQETVRSGLNLANAAAALVTTRKGALCAMPEASEVETFLRSHV